MELNALRAECTAYDFKVMLEEKKPKSWLKSVSAFANGLGGSLFFGIDNDGIVKGLDDVQHVCKAISSRIRDYMDSLPEVEMIPHDIDGLHVLQLKVNAGHYTPYYYVGDGQRITFVRVGDESMPATAEQMVRLVLKGPTKLFQKIEKTTSITTAKREAATPAVNYSFNGQQLPAARRGLNIIRMSDGTVRKVMMK